MKDYRRLEFLKKLIEEIQKDFDYFNKNRFGYIMNVIETDIKVDLEICFDFKIKDLFDMSRVELEKLQEILRNENIDNYYVLTLVNEKIKDVEFLTKEVFNGFLRDITEEILNKLGY